jgi:two-component system cell cycle response regulator CpdR
MVLAILQDMLEDLGCDVITAASADEALDRLCSNREIALLVSDVNMPEMEGVELAKRAERSLSRCSPSQIRHQSLGSRA